VGTRLGNSIGGIVLLASFACPFPSCAQDAPLGVVQQANLAHLGQGAVTEGTTIYAGEMLSTEAGGALELRVASSRFGLLENSQASFYPRPKGSAAELSGGTLTFRRDAGGADIAVVASDVRIVPQGEGAVMGQVAIVSPCKITVTSFLGPLRVTSGTETRTIKEKESYSVIPEVSVLDVRAHVSPDDPEYHQSHTHKTCAAPQIAHSRAPVAAGASRFLLIAAATVGAATVMAVSEAWESPDRP
jgi:hypothetical protein